MLKEIRSWFTFPDDLVRQIAMAIIGVGILSFGMIIGAAIATISIKSNLYEEAFAADDAIWIRINTIENEKGDLMDRIDRLSRIMDQYDLAVAQIKVYERRQEIMNVRFSDED